MSKALNVFIPAAGLGERLQPITEHIPRMGTNEQMGSNLKNTLYKI